MKLFYTKHWNNTANGQWDSLDATDSQSQSSTTTSHSTGHWLVDCRWLTGRQTYCGLPAGCWQQTNTVAVLLRNKPVILRHTNTAPDWLLQIMTSHDWNLYCYWTDVQCRVPMGKLSAWTALVLSCTDLIKNTSTNQLTSNTTDQ